MRTPSFFVWALGWSSVMPVFERWVPGLAPRVMMGRPSGLDGGIYVSFTLLMAILPEKHVAMSDPGSDSLCE